MNLRAKDASGGADLDCWRKAQAVQARALAEAAQELGRLDATLAALPEAEAQGARQRLALEETEAMLWAEGLVLRRDEIGRDLMGARVSSDPEAMRLARWAIRRLEGQGGLADLAGFLGLHRRQTTRDLPDEAVAVRPRGAEFDATADEFLTIIGNTGDLHPLATGPLTLMLWRLAGLSPPERIAEGATWSARHMAGGCDCLRFVPLGRQGRRVWTAYGPPADRLSAHLEAVLAGAKEARQSVRQISRWAASARAATAGIKGDNPARVIAVLAARPLASAMQVEAEAGISRITAERMLNRFAQMGLTREVTGGSRFRFWTANLGRG
nr:DUF1403 family protein [Paracoccus saliphilus]